MTRVWFIGWTLESLLLAEGIVAAEQAIDHGFQFASWTSTWREFWISVVIALIVLLVGELIAQAFRSRRA